MIEDWKPQWTANDLKTVGFPLLFLFGTVYGFYLIRQCVDVINTVPWYSTILINPMAAAFGAGFVTYFLYDLALTACILVRRELTK